MKKLAISLFAILPFLSYAQEDVVISGKISGTQDDQKVFLLYGGTFESSALKDGNFSISLQLEVPRVGILAVGKTLAMSSSKPRLSFYLEPGKINITGAQSDLANAQVSAGPDNVAYAELLKANQPVEDFSKELRSWYQQTKKEDRETDAFKKQLEEKTEQNIALAQSIASAFVKAHPNSEVSILAIETAGGASPDINYVAPLFEGLTSEVKSSPVGKKYAVTLETIRKTAIGAVAPVFTQQDTAGVEVSLTQFRGKYVLLDFWASWCGPCRAENPNVVNAFETYKGKNFTVLGVSLDNENARGKWLKAIQADGLQGWTQLSDLKDGNNTASKLYGVRGIPANFLIDPSGKIVAKDLRGEALEKKLEELL